LKTALLSLRPVSIEAGTGLLSGAARSEGCLPLKASGATRKGRPVIAAEWTCAVRKAVSDHYMPAGSSIGGVCAPYHTLHTMAGVF
jgi:hypothetical protein